jgi:hypothetical protein
VLSQAQNKIHGIGSRRGKIKNGVGLGEGVEDHQGGQGDPGGTRDKRI